MNRRLVTQLVLGIIFMGGMIGFVQSHAAEMTLEATRSELQKIPIWVMDFTNEDSHRSFPLNHHDEVENVLKADLTRSQVFSVADLPAQTIGFHGDKCLRSSNLNGAADKGVTVTTWGRVGVGGPKGRETGLIFDACAFDTGNKEIQIGKRYFSRKATGFLLRLMAHKWADELVYQYTGEQGVARTKIAYVSQEKTGRELFVMDYDGHGPRQVTADGFLSLMPTWSRDRKFLVYTAYRKQKQQIIKRELASGQEEMLVGPASLNITPAFSPDGKWLAYASAEEGNSDIYTLEMKTMVVTQLTSHRGADLSPSWSPDGQRLAFTSDRGGRPQIYIMKRDGSQERRITYEGNYNAAPSWSPQGDWIAYVCQIPHRGFKLCRITPDGRQVAQITKGRSIDDSPSWSPNGRHLVFSSMGRGKRRRGKSDIYFIHRDGTGLERLTSGGIHYSSPAWSPFLQ